MSEVPLYQSMHHARYLRETPTFMFPVDNAPPLHEQGYLAYPLHGYLAHKKQRPP